MASIKKRPNGNYQATIFIGRDENGKQQFKYLTRPSRKECVAAARKIEQEIEEGKFVKLEKIRVVAALEKWLELNESSLSPSTVTLYQVYIKKHFVPFFKDMKINKINEFHIRQFMNDKLKTLSKSSVRRIMSVLKRSLGDIMKDRSPVKDVKLPEEEKSTPHLLTDDEMKMIHETVKGTRDEPIILLAGWCGLRRGEIFALKADDVSVQKGTLIIDESYSATPEGKYVLKRPKSENSVREVVVPKYLMNLLENIVKQMMKEGRMGERLFPMRPDSYSSYFAKLVRKHNFPPIRFHDLRHYHASWMYSQGIFDQYAAQRLGHDIDTLKRIYQHLALHDQQAVEDNIRNMFPGGESIDQEDAK